MSGRMAAIVVGLVVVSVGLVVMLRADDDKPADVLSVLGQERTSDDELPDLVGDLPDLDESSLRHLGDRPDGVGYWVGPNDAGQICLVTVSPEVDRWIATGCGSVERLKESGLNGTSSNPHMTSVAVLLPDGCEIDADTMERFQLEMIGPNLAVGDDPDLDLPPRIEC